MVTSSQRVFKDKPYPQSLRLRVALVIAALSFLPNVLMVVVVVSSTTQQLGQAAFYTWLPLYGWMLAVILLSSAIGYAFSSQLLKPLRALRKQIAGLQEKQGISQVRLNYELSDPSEVDHLKTSFNKLLAQIDLEQTRRSAFVASLMHDLKTPLIAVGHLLSVIQEDSSLSKEERLELITHLRRENQSVISLIQKMVDAYKFEREAIVLERQTCHLDVLVDIVCRRIMPLAVERGVTLAYTGKAVLEVDARELERALYNLVSNAVRYASSRIDISILAHGIRITDDGPGLPSSLDNLTQPFNAQPVTIAGQEYTAGTGGLGLFIARRIIEAHGGQLVLENTGTGTTFLIELGEP